MAEADARFRITAENLTKQAFGEIQRQMGDVERASGSLRNALTGVGAGLSLAGIAAFVKSGIDAADDLNKLSQKVGVSVESLSALNYAAKLSDVSLEGLSTGLRQLSKNAADTAAGTGDAQAAFRALGIDVKNSAGQLKGTEELLLLVAEQFEGIEDGAGKTALAMRIFGRAGADLIPFLNQGRAGLEELRAEAERLGIVISGETARAAERFNDDLTRLGASAEKVKFQLAEGVLPALTKMTEELLQGNKISGGFLESLRLFGTINPFRDIVGNLREFNAELKELEKRRAAFLDFDGAVPAGLDQSISDARKRIEFLKFQQRQQALALLPPGFQDDANRLARTNPTTGKRAAPGLAGGGGTSDDGFAAALRQLEEEATKVQELTRFEETLVATQTGRYAKLTESRKQQLLLAAAEVDRQRDIAKLGKEMEQTRKSEADETERLARAEKDRLTQIADRTKDIVDPTRAWRREVESLVEAYNKGYVTITELNAAAQAPELRELLSPKRTSFDVLNEALKEGDISLEQYREAVKRLRGEVEETTDIGRELGLTFTSAFEQMIESGGKASDMLKSLAMDVAKLFFRQSVTTPLLDAASAAFKGFDLSALLGSIFGGARAGGGPVAGGRAYLVGERGPELFVPSAAGQIVPNGASGGTFYIDARGADSAGLARVEHMIRTLHGSIERRAVSAVADAQLRGARV